MWRPLLHRRLLFVHTKKSAHGCKSSSLFYCNRQLNKPSYRGASTTLGNHAEIRNLTEPLTLKKESLHESFVEESLIEAEENIERSLIGLVDVDGSTDLELHDATTLKKQKIKKNVKIDVSDADQLPLWRESGIIASIDAKLAQNKVLDALTEINSYRRNDVKFGVKIFNLILHGFGALGLEFDAKVLINSLPSENVRPDLQSYAALIEATWNNNDGNKDISHIIHVMKAEGFDPNYLFDKCILTKKQSETILTALTAYDQSYMPIFRDIPNVSYPPVLKGFDDSNNISSHGQPTLELNFATLKQLTDLQLERETKVYVPIKSIERNQNVNIGKEESQYINITRKWKTALKEKIEIEINNWKNGIKATDKYRNRYSPYISLIDADELAEIVINSTLPVLCSQPYGVPSGYVCRHLGAIVHERYAIRHKEQAGVIEKVSDVYTAYASQLLNNECNNKSYNEIWHLCDTKSELNLSLQSKVPVWPKSIEALVAGTLLDFLIDVASFNPKPDNKNKLNKHVNAITHGYEVFNSKRYGVLQIHKSMANVYKKHLKSQGEMHMESNKLPMLVPPRPWASINEGGYLIQPAPLMRTVVERYESSTLEKSIASGQVNAVLNSLNSLGSCAWKVNSKILDLMIHVFNNKDAKNLELVGLEAVPDFKFDAGDTPELEAKKRHAIEKAMWKKLANEQYSIEMDLLYKLSVANHYRDNIFWLPINLDFRGRVYPIPPHCCHTGSDVARGMLLFANGRQLGHSGLRWLKIHLANLHGAKSKGNLDEREQFADEMKEEIFDSADRPFEGNRWWQSADEPWQTLATCIELTNALRCDEPEKYISHLPVHQDGSCNGLQHYAALGHDEYGGSQVNLTPSSKPADLYSEVAKLVERRRVADAENGDPIALKLDGMVQRKVVKQTVMTVVYGVTFVGGRLQIEKQLKDLDFPIADRFVAASYLAKKVFESIGEMFTSAKAIQNWLTDAAGQVSLAGHCVDWVTPLGLPVVQPYHRMVSSTVGTPLQYIYDQSPFDTTQKPHYRKQKSAFPPNFVHSLDSCHMMLTSLYCQRMGVNFASVHDSFWTHASDVDTMNKICREQFVTLHNQPILEDLKKHFEAGYGGKRLERPMNDKKIVDFDPLPDEGTFDLNSVLQSTYFFS